jgi:RNA polymerase sigma factor (TIGR02999 family)
MNSAPDVTALLQDWSRGSETALAELLPAVYKELRQIATRQLRHERADHTLQPTALVHEAYLRFLDQRQVDWKNRRHFFGVVSAVMRRILVDHARRHDAEKRGDGRRALPIEDAGDVAAPNDHFVLALDRALDRLHTIDPDLVRMIEFRVFAGLTIDEAAQVLDVSPSTAKRDWRAAKAWLTREMGLRLHQ